MIARSDSLVWSPREISSSVTITFAGVPDLSIGRYDTTQCCHHPSLPRSGREWTRAEPRHEGPQAPIPLIVATQSRGFDERGDFTVYNPYKREVDAVQRGIAELLPYADVVIDDDLVPPAYPCGQSSCVHFHAAAPREQGERFHAALERVRGRGTAFPATEPAPPE